MGANAANISKLQKSDIQMYSDIQKLNKKMKQVEQSTTKKIDTNESEIDKIKKSIKQIQKEQKELKDRPAVIEKVVQEVEVPKTEEVISKA